MAHEVDAFLYIYPELSKVCERLDETAALLEAWHKLVRRQPFEDLNIEAANELVSCLGDMLPVDDSGKKPTPHSERNNLPDIPTLRLLELRLETQILQHSKQLAELLASSKLQSLVDVHWPCLRANLEEVCSALGMYDNRFDNSFESFIADLYNESHLTSHLGIQLLGEWGYRFLTISDDLRDRFSSPQHSWAGAYTADLVELLYCADPNGSKKRVPYKRSQHEQWKAWREEESLSHAAIARRHSERTGERVTPSAVAKALRRWNERDNSQMSMDN